MISLNINQFILFIIFTTLTHEPFVLLGIWWDNKESKRGTISLNNDQEYIKIVSLNLNLNYRLDPL